MGQSLSQLKIGGLSIRPGEAEEEHDHEQRPISEYIHEGEDDTPSEASSLDSEEEKAELEAIADEFMNQRAFSAVADKYDIPDDYISQDLPMEVRIRVGIANLAALGAPQWMVFRFLRILTLCFLFFGPHRKLRSKTITMAWTTRWKKSLYARLGLLQLHWRLEWAQKSDVRLPGKKVLSSALARSVASI